MFKKKILLAIFIVVIMTSTLYIYVYKLTPKYNKDLKNIQNNNIDIEEVTQKAEATYKNFLKVSCYQNSNLSPMYYLLVELGLTSEENIMKSKPASLEDALECYPSNVLYEDFKTEMLKYVSNSFFEENYSSYINMNGYVGISNSSAGIPVDNLDSIEFISMKDERYSFNVTVIDTEMYDHYLNPSPGENISKDDYLFSNMVTFVEEDGNFVVDEVK